MKNASFWSAIAAIAFSATAACSGTIEGTDNEATSPIPTTTPAVESPGGESDGEDPFFAAAPESTKTEETPNEETPSETKPEEASPAPAVAAVELLLAEAARQVAAMK